MKNESFVVNCTEFNLLCDKITELIIERYKEDYYTYQITENIYSLHFEKYYFRTNSNLMMSVILKRLDEQRVEFKVISGGGKQSLTKSDWGAEDSSIVKFINLVTRILAKNNWRYDQIDDYYLK